MGDQADLVGLQEGTAVEAAIKENFDRGDNKKKRDSHLPKPVDQLQQVPVSKPPVVGMGLEPTLWKQEVQGDDTRVGALPLDRSIGGMTKRVCLLALLLMVLAVLI